MRFLSRIICFLLLAAFVQPAFAVYNPRETPNNKYGIHVADTNDVVNTAPLVNSAGGDWGYVTLVIQDNDRNFGKWQEIFNAMRRLRLIPIVRIATHPVGDWWAKPTEEAAGEWATFLNSLNWPIANRYVVLFNEPNHAKEWGNTLDPEGYASVLMAYSKALKSASEDFFVLPAGFDASARSDGEAMDEAVFLKRMLASAPGLFDAIDGWASHSYPNPGFSGSPTGWGRGSLRTYQWELSLLSDLGNTKTLPVFITETGWAHSEGKRVSAGFFSAEKVAENFRLAADVWQDPLVVAVTPFVFNYQDVPFDNFSWQKLGSQEFYPQFDTYKAVPKVAGRPKQRLIFNLTHPLFPPVLIAGSSYNLATTVKNEGGGILDPRDDYQLVVQTEKNDFIVTPDPLPTLQPGESGDLSLSVKTPMTTGTDLVTVFLKHYGTQVILERHPVKILPAPSLSLRIQLGWRRRSDAGDTRVLIYDGNRLIRELRGLSVEDGSVRVEGVTDIIPGNSYRIVAVVPYYLPRQSIQVLTGQTTEVAFKRFLPLDLNGDGAFTPADILATIKLPPKTLIARFIGP